MSKQLSEAAAWRKLAEWCAEHESLLCIALDDWARGGSFYDHPPFLGPWNAMYEAIHPMAKESIVPPADPSMCGTALDNNEPNSDARVMFCLLMALECEEDGK